MHLVFWKIPLQNFPETKMALFIKLIKEALKSHNYCEVRMGTTSSGEIFSTWVNVGSAYTNTKYFIINQLEFHFTLGMLRFHQFKDLYIRAYSTTVTLTKFPSCIKIVVLDTRKNSPSDKNWKLKIWVQSVKWRLLLNMS